MEPYDDYDVFLNASEFNSTYEYVPSENEHYLLIAVQVLSIVGLLSITCNILIGIVIVKYRQPRQYIMNFCLMNVCILYSVFNVVMVLMLWIKFNFYFRSSAWLWFQAFCVATDIQLVVLFSTFFLLFIMTITSYAQLCADRKKLTFYCQCFIGLVYVLAIFVSAISMAHCIQFEHFFFDNLTVVALTVISALVLVASNIYHGFQKCTGSVGDNLGLVFTNIFVLMWCPAYLYYHLTPWYGTNLVNVILWALAMSSPVANLIYLMYCDRSYFMFVKHICTCKCKDFDHDMLGDQPVAYRADNIRHAVDLVS